MTNHGTVRWTWGIVFLRKSKELGFQFDSLSAWQGSCFPDKHPMTRTLPQSLSMRVPRPNRRAAAKELSPDPNTELGFTLVEMMVVVAIVATLATIATVAYRRHIRGGRVIAAQTFMATIQARQETYMSQNGQYCDVSGAGWFPTIQADEPVAKLWNDTTIPADWKTLAARPENGQSYFAFYVLASTPPNHTIPAAVAANAIIGIPAQPSVASGIDPHPWWYAVAHGDLDGDDGGGAGGCNATPTTLPASVAECTVIFTSSAKSNIAVYNVGE